jgi:O-antigen/teichoic acid export membrane protein
MLADKVDTAPMTATAHRASFFRQSGWLMFATVVGGLFFTAVHFLSKFIPEAEYGQFGVFLSVAMFIPALPLQMVLAQQTARALALHREHELSGLIRAAWLGTFVIWLVAVGVVLLFQGPIMAQWKITNPAALYLTLPVLLFTVWLPMFSGVLQGQQNFLSLGWSGMANGVGRLAIAAFAVLVLHYFASGMMLGMLIGLGIAVLIAIWPTRSLWLSSPQSFEWRSLLRQIVPLTLGFGAYQFLLTADTMFVKTYFSSDEAAYYVSAGTLSRASMWLVGPLAAVMFPKIVHAKAKAEKSDLMGIVLIGTLVLAAGGATGLWVLGPWVVRFMFKPSYLEAASVLLPWYAWAVVPLAVANVLLNNLLARSLFKVVPALCVLVGVYAFALTQFRDTPVTVIKTLGVCNVLLLAVCAYYTWGVKQSKVEGLKSKV